MSELFVCRQPILNRYKETIGYELLYRAVATDTRANISDGNSATSLVFLNTLFEMGLKSIVGSQVAYINFTRDFLLKDDLIQLLAGIRTENFDPSKVILEVMEDITLDADLFQALIRFKAKRFQIALDDVTSIDQIAPVLGLGLVEIVKVDMMAVDRTLLPNLVQAIKQYDVQLLAEKVETPKDFLTCLDLGFDFFQGYFFHKPEIVKDKKKKMDVSQLSLIRSLAAIMSPRANFRVLEPIISQDVGFSYKLLRLVNSGYYSMAGKVTSIQQAISMVGLQQLRGWMMLLLMTAVDDKPHELTAIALQRAKMCELLGNVLGDRQPESYFLIGLLSVLDAIMDLPMLEVVESLSLSTEIMEALVYRKGTLGQILSGVIEGEGGNWDNVLRLGFKPDVWQNKFFESAKWSNIIMTEVYADSR